MITYQVALVPSGHGMAFGGYLDNSSFTVIYQEGRFTGVDKSFVLPAQSNKGFTQVKLLKDGPSLIGMVAEIIFSPVTAFESLAIF